MVIWFSICFLATLLTQILFFAYAMTHKAKGDRNFIAIQIMTIAIVLAQALNMFFLHFGEGGFLLSKICFSSFLSLFIITVGIFARITVDKFYKRTQNSRVISFIITIIVFCACSISFINLYTEEFFVYVVCPIESVFLKARGREYITVFEFGHLWNVYAFFWLCLIFIYGVLIATRIALRTLINCVHEILIIIIFIIQFSCFVFFIKDSAVLSFEMTYFCFLLPFGYYFFVYEDRPLFVKRIFRSKLFDYTEGICVIFNADELLTDFNNAAKSFFGFTKKDVYSLSLGKFISDFVPIGTIPSDNFTIDQIYIKGKGDERRICQLNFSQVSYFKGEPVCSFFILRDISEIIKHFTDIQQASMTDNLTGLLAQHILEKKVREINMYRRFPYSVAVCTIKLKQEATKQFNYNIALIRVSECIRLKIRGNDLAAYENGTIVLLFYADLRIAKNVMERIEDAISRDNLLNEKIEFNYGLSSRETPDEDIRESIGRAHSLMFENTKKM